MKLRLILSPRRGAPGDPLRSHIHGWLDRLPGKLPPHDRKQLLDDLCFLLRSPLFLYAIAPRLHHASNPLKGDSREKDEDFNIHALNMMIVRDDNSWATQLLYGKALLIEGRQYITSERADRAQSFDWFCDEARFLSCEFHARELAASEALGTAVDVKPAVVEPVQVEVRQTRARTAALKERRIVKLRIRYRMIHGRPVLTEGLR